MSDIKKHNFVSDILRSFILSYLAAATLEYCLLMPKLRDLHFLSSINKMSLARVLAVTAAGTLILMILDRIKYVKTAARWLMAGVFFVLAAFTVYSSYTTPYLIVCILILLAFVIYAVFGWDSSPEPASDGIADRKVFIWLTTAFSVAFFIFDCVWTVSRVYSYASPSFDFGIFSQMFYYMKETGLPMTTIERDGLLSHFNVHMSPIYYLMLPFYFIAPFPATLQILQAAVITSAVIPLWKTGSLHGLKDWQKSLLCAVLLLFPAFSGGTSYDLHENCFLIPLILWLFYGIDKKNTVITVIAAMLTLLVKEDAAVYVAVIALYLVVKSVVRSDKGKIRDIITGVSMLAVAVGYFLLVTHYLSQSGDGVMTYRYNNFMYDGSSSLISVIKAVIMNPMKVVFECVDAEKLKFIVLTMLPLCALPLITRRYERYILLIPYILINLMSDYRYQHDIFFQYTFGSTACLIYLAALNLADLKITWQRASALCAAAAVSLCCFGTVVVPKAMRYPDYFASNRDRFDEITEVLDRIPEDASVAATTFYSVRLSQRKVLYDTGYCSKDNLLSCDYIVAADNADFKKYARRGKNGRLNFIDLLYTHGYYIEERLPGVLTVYKKGPVG